MKRAFGFLLLLSASLTAAKVSGKWAGSMTLPDGSTTPVFLTLIEQGTAISGSIALGTDEGQVPIKKVELRGQLLTFRAPDNVFHGIAFQLTVTDRSLIGEGTLVGVQPLKVSLFPGPPLLRRGAPGQVSGHGAALCSGKPERQSHQDARAPQPRPGP